MKSLKIKKFLKIFSVIICSIFIFSSKANALVLKNGDNVPDLPELKTEYYTILYSSQYNNYVLIFYEEQYVKTVNGIENSYVQDNPAGKSYYRIFHNSFGGICNNYDVYFYYLENDEWKYKGHDCYSAAIPYINEWDTSLVYNGVDGFFTEETVSPNSIFGTVKDYYNTYIQYSTINLFKHFYNGQFETPQLIYSTDMNNNKNEEEKPVNFRMQFNNDVSPNLKQIVFDFPITAFNNDNTVNARIEYGNWSNIIEEIPIFNSIKIYGYDINGNEIELNHWIGYGYNTTDYLTSKQIDIKFSLTNQPNDTIPNNILRVKVYFDFETFNNNYYFNVFDNFIEGTTNWSYIENFLVDYKKYEFKENYDIAIIRSKNYQNIDSFYISDKIYFTSTEYNFNLKVYDFNNKLEKYNFTSLTQYLINDVYLKIPLEIDEKNNIFPILTKAKENESGTFYLKNDLFVQWYDSETGNILIENESEENFNNNNDLNISNEDKENIKPIEQDNQNSIYVFFNNFWKMFEKFGDNFSYITSCFTTWYNQLPQTIQFFLCISFAFVIYKMLTSFIL